MKKNTAQNTEPTYSYYSKVLAKPFDTLEELAAAEAAYYDKLREKEDKAAQKKADAKKVEDAFKDLNTARKAYKDNLTQLTKEYSEKLEDLKNTYEFGKKDITSKLAQAEATYKAALEEFTGKYEQYHITLKDGDFETTISSQTTVNNTESTVDYSKLFDLFDMFFKI